MKVLIVRFSSIGDIVLTTPVIRCLALQLPEIQIHYLTKPAYQPVIQSNPYILKLHLLNDDWQKMIDELSAEKFDYIIDLHHNLRTLRLIKALKEVPHFSYNKLNAKKWFLTALKINVLPHKHIVERYLETVTPFGVVNDGRGLDYFIDEKDEVSYDRLPLSHCAGFIVIVIGATYATKKLPVSKLKELCIAIDHPIILLGGEEDKTAGNEIAMVDDIKIFNACGKFSINESADLVRKAKLVISHDTGLMHIAAAFQKPIISVWGNTVPAFGMSPYYGNPALLSTISIQSKTPKSILSEVNKLYCRPCSKIGYKRCPVGHFKCMEKQDMQSINRAVVKILYGS